MTRHESRLARRELARRRGAGSVTAAEPRPLYDAACARWLRTVTDYQLEQIAFESSIGVRLVNAFLNELKRSAAATTGASS